MTVQRDEVTTDLRSQILAAAQRVIQARGAASATTRAIAEEARCAEGSIYRYFTDKHALFHAVAGEHFTKFVVLAETLPKRAGSSTVAKNLEEFVVASLRFYRAVRPVVVGALGDREFLEEQRRHFAQTSSGPMKSIGGVSTYLRREQRLGRVAEGASPEFAARVLLGASFSQTVLEELVDPSAVTSTDERLAREMVRTVMEGLRPSPAASA